MNAPHVVVRPAAADTWADVVAVMTTTGDSGHCWCQWFHQRGPRWAASDATSRRADLEHQVATGHRPPGVVAQVDGDPAGWCAVAPRASYDRIRAGRKLAAAGVGLGPADHAAAAAAADPGPVGGVWAVTCFVVRSQHRGRGLTRALLDGAVALAADGGADVVEGYPVDPARRDRTTSTELYVGSLGTFLAAGFTVAGRSSPARPVVRRAVRPR